VAWNQINDAQPSQILGNLNANGYVVLQNANGFYVGESAAITAHGLIMTTASTPAFNLSSGGSWVLMRRRHPHRSSITARFKRQMAARLF